MGAARPVGVVFRSTRRLSPPRRAVARKVIAPAPGQLPSIDHPEGCKSSRNTSCRSAFGKPAPAIGRSVGMSICRQWLWSGSSTGRKSTPIGGDISNKP